MEARGGLRAIAGKRQQPYYHFIQTVFCYFLFLSARVLFSLPGYARNHFSNGNWITILRFCFEALTPELLKPDKYKLKVNREQIRWLREIRIPLRRRHHNKVWEGGQTKATACNITENKRNVLSHNICSTNIFDREQTSCNMIQQHTIWYNNMQQGGQTVQRFSSQQMLYVVVWKVGIVWPGPNT